ncbi:hypothetical protein Dimus_019013 [Dionaea muscipula]
MEISITKGSLRMIFILLGLILSLWVQVQASPQILSCTTKGSPCFLKKIQCPEQCPTESPKDSTAKVCYVDCNSPICKAECRSRKPNCNGYGAACMDPRFIGGDGIVFYFHGKSNEHFSLVTDSNLQINARFIGLRPAGRSRDYTWIQALGILFAHHMSFTLEATKAETWDNEVDHLKFTYDGKEVVMSEEHQFSWTSPSQDLKIERTSNKNSAMVTLAGIAEIKVNVVPITKDDNRVHNYQIPSNDCFAHLESAI